MSAIALPSGNFAQVRTKDHPVIDPTHYHFGALVDGAHDDAAAVQAALTYARNAGGGRVVLPRGTCRLATALAWPDGAGIELLGQGRGQTTLLLDQAGGASTAAAITLTSAAGYSGARIADLTLRGAANDGTACYDAILVNDRVNDSLFENLELYWFRHSGIRYSSSSPGARAVVRNVYAHDICTSAMVSIAGGAILGSYPYQRVMDSDFVNIGNNSQFHAVYLGTHDDPIVSRSNFTGTHTRLQFFGGDCLGGRVEICLFEGNTQVILQGMAGLVFTGNTLRRTPINVGADRVQITGNNSHNPDGTLDLIFSGAAANDVLVADNVLNQLTENNGVYVTLGSRWDIRDNRIASLGSAIRFGGGSYHLAESNRIVTASGSEQIFVPAGGATFCRTLRNTILLSKVGGSVRPLRDEGGSGTNLWVGNIIDAPTAGSIDLTGVTNVPYYPYP